VPGGNVSEWNNAYKSVPNLVVGICRVNMIRLWYIWLQIWKYGKSKM